VLGPMVYAAAWCCLKDEKRLMKMGFMDSKVLKQQVRQRLFSDIRKSNIIGFKADVISPEILSHNMTSIQTKNLNIISHESAMNLIQHAIDYGANITQVFVDTVGPPKKYQAKLEARFPQISITVSKKADSIYPIVSAASICAKELRDECLKNWYFKEPDLNVTRDFGSGYPSDPVTKEWMKKNVDKVFGFPCVVRFSWKTCVNAMDVACVKVEWGDDNEGRWEEDASQTRFTMPSVRNRYFAKKEMSLVRKLD